MFHRLIIRIFIAISLSSIGGLAADKPEWKELLVPTSLSTSIIKNSIPYVDGWVPTKKEYGYGLAWVGVFIGTPDWEWAGLFATESKVERFQLTEWDLGLAPKGKRKWIVCAYHYTQAEVRMELPSTMKRLRVTTDNGNICNGLPNVTKVEYQ